VHCAKASFPHGSQPALPISVPAGPSRDGAQCERHLLFPGCYSTRKMNASPVSIATTSIVTNTGIFTMSPLLHA